MYHPTSAQHDIPSKRVVFETKFGWTSIKCFYDNSHVYLATVEFVMETFDRRPPKFSFEKCKKVAARGVVTDNRCNYLLL